MFSCLLAAVLISGRLVSLDINFQYKSEFHSALLKSTRDARESGTSLGRRLTRT